MTGARPKRWFPGVALGALLVALVLAGCGETAPSGPEGSVGAPAAGDYLSTPASSFPLLAGTRVQLTLDGSSLSASAGCNTLGAGYSFDGTTLVVGEVASTMMGCAEDLMNQDGRLSAFLTGRPTLTDSADGFTLTGEGEATLVMVGSSVADPNRTLESTVWVLDGVIDGDVASSAAGFDGVTLLFAGGAATLTSPCSVGATSYTLVTPDTLDTPAMTVTDIPGSAGCESYDVGVDAVAALFGGTMTATVEGGMLTLTRGDQGATFGAS